MKELKRCDGCSRFGGPTVKEICHHGESFGPVVRRHIVLKQQGMDNVVESSNDMLGFPILLGHVGTRQTVEDE